MNLTLPMASSSDAARRQLHVAVRFSGRLTRVEGRLERCQPVVLQHVQEGLRVLRKYVNPSRPVEGTHRLARIVKPEEQDLCVLVQQACRELRSENLRSEVAPNSRTKLGEDVPKPVDNEHGVVGGKGG